MSNLPIIIEPNPILHQKCRKVTKFDGELKKLAQDMVETLFANKGIGLSSPQVGKNLRLVVIEFDPERFTNDEQSDSKKNKFKIKEKIPLTILVNPKITNFSREKEVAEEGCLSLPGIEVNIERAIKINVLGYDLQEERLKIRAKGLFARILQHEIDHLEGILITDRGQKKISTKSK